MVRRYVMRQYRSYTISLFQESLEQRLNLSAINSLITVPPVLVASAVSHNVDDPPPDPEPDPGPLPTDDPPIIYPPIPPAGPVGPGICIH
jgi:hypothetical protein